MTEKEIKAFFQGMDHAQKIASEKKRGQANAIQKERATLTLYSERIKWMTEEEIDALEPRQHVGGNNA